MTFVRLLILALKIVTISSTVWLQDSLMLAQRSRIHIATDIYSQVRDVLTLQKVDRYHTEGVGGVNEINHKLTLGLQT